jgi:hypothetical protein
MHRTGQAAAAFSRGKWQKHSIAPTLPSACGWPYIQRQAASGPRDCSICKGDTHEPAGKRTHPHNGPYMHACASCHTTCQNVSVFAHVRTHTHTHPCIYPPLACLLLYAYLQYRACAPCALGLLGPGQALWLGRVGHLGAAGAADQRCRALRPAVWAWEILFSTATLSHLELQRTAEKVGWAAGNRREMIGRHRVLLPAFIRVHDSA